MREMLVLVDDDDRIIGTAPRSVCHGNPNLVHRAVHLLVFNSSGELYLQKRHETKIIQPGKWDSSVGGHLSPNETYEIAARRETHEELGFMPDVLSFLFCMKIRNGIESENIKCFSTTFDGEVNPNKDEISEGRYWTNDQIMKGIGSGVFTPAFIEEFRQLSASPVKVR